jgi:hypothetical protein
MFLGSALVMAGTAAVHAEDDNTPLMTKFLRGIGLRNQEGNIEYKERAPLVVPPTRDLPQPVPTDSMAVRSSAWPTDPDMKRHAAQQHKPAKKDIKTYDPELAAKGDGAAETTPSEPSFAGRMWRGVLDLGNTVSGGTDAETARFAHEPPRNALTDPPTGYRTPSAAQPYGINGKPDKPKADAKTDRQIESVGGK